MERVFIGKIVNTHGIKGEFRIKSDFDAKSKVFVVGKNIIINNTSYEIASYRVHKGYDMVTIKGFNNINDVLSFKGKNVFVDRDTLELSPDEYILDDLIGSKVLVGEDELGVVKDYTNGENPLLEVKGAKVFYIPIKADFIIKFDKDKRILYVDESTRGLII